MRSLAILATLLLSIPAFSAQMKTTNTTGAKNFSGMRIGIGVGSDTLFQNNIHGEFTTKPVLQTSAGDLAINFSIGHKNYALTDSDWTPVTATAEWRTPVYNNTTSLYARVGLGYNFVDVDDETGDPTQGFDKDFFGVPVQFGAEFIAMSTSVGTTSMFGQVNSGFTFSEKEAERLYRGPELLLGLRFRFI